MPYFRVVDVCLDPFDIHYRYWGTGLVRMLCHDRTGHRLSTMSLKRVPQAFAEYRTMIEEKAPFALIYNATTSRNASPL